jgi:hypothetical protein
VVSPESCDPVIDPIVTAFPLLMRPPLNVKRSPNRPVPLLYDIPPVAESEVKLILLLNVFQSVAERAPVVVEFARARERDVPERESPFAGEPILMAHDASVSTTSPFVFTERNLPVPTESAEVERSCVNLRPDIHPVPELISSLVLGVVVQIPILPVLSILNNFVVAVVTSNNHTGFGVFTFVPFDI